jgi:D-arabinose 1-dehydrogenase-like Zn-dependent alcohol dehydrogenase
MCMSGNDMLCRKGGLIGVVTNGGFAEFMAALHSSFLLLLRISRE